MINILDMIEDDNNLLGLEQVKCSVAALEEIVAKKQCIAFVWDNDDEDCEPLAVDMWTANVLVTVLNAVKEETRNQIVSKIESCRGEFGLFHEKALKCVS